MIFCPVAIAAGHRPRPQLTLRRSVGHNNAEPQHIPFSQPLRSVAIETPVRLNWTCLVDKDGQVEELEDRTGAGFIRCFGDIIRYARALLLSDRDQLLFHAAPDASHIYRVLILRDHVPRAREFASILMRRVALPSALTLREFDVLTLLAGGLSNENISLRLAISTRTVAKHVENIFQKTALWSRSALAGYAVDQGLLRLPTPGGYRGYPLAIARIE